MFDHVWAPLLPSFRAGILRGLGRPLGLAIAVAVAASAGLLATTAGSAYAANPDTAAGPSIQYQEALAHRDKTYSFTTGSPANVPFQPRPGDSALVDGAAAVPLPASRASGVKAPNVARPGTVAPNTALTALRREVLGFLPYWELGSTLNYDTLSTVAYFGVNLNGDGTLAKSGNGWNGWVSSSMTSVINDAHAHGTRVALTVESFAWDAGGRATQSAVLSSPAVSLTAAQNIAAEVASRGVDGVNLDFEPIAAGQYSNFAPFIRMLRAELDKVHPGYELTFCATGAPGTYDLPNLLAAGAADAVFIMAYDLRGGTPAYTGSIDPLTSPSPMNNTYTLTKVVNTYLSQVPASKVLLGLPWYGHAWSTGTSNAVYAKPADMTTYGQPASGITYASALDIAAAHLTDAIPGNGLQYDATEQTAWTAYYGTFGGTSPTWRELYFDDPRALSVKIDAIDGWNLRGLGIWCLGYDNNNGNGDMTNVVGGKLETSIAPTTYHALTPTRILDSRNGTGLSNVFNSHVARTLQVAGVGGVPLGATAVTGNLTVTSQTSAGYLYLGPVSADNPTSSTVNFPKGDDRANGVTVALNMLGTLSATYVPSTSPATTHVIFDVTGYFTPDTSGATYIPLTPSRVLDTRNGTGSWGSLGSHNARTFTVANGTSGVPGNAVAVTGNLTVTAQNSTGYLYVGPNPANNPTSSTINFPVGDDRANSVTVALGSGGTLSVTFVGSGAAPYAQVVFDVTGYFTPDASGSTFVPLTPSRIVDTRSGTGLSGPFSAHSARYFGITGHGGVPTGATAVTGNLTVTAQTSGGYLYLGPNSVNNPTTSTLNFPKGDDRANGATVAVGPGGTLAITYVPSASVATTHAIFDVTGYFAH